MARTALIIDDESDTVDLLSQLIAQRGFEAVWAYTGREGLDKAKSRPPDLLLLDLVLPDIDGFEVCETLRANRDTNLIPIVMTTALGGHEHKVRGFRVGATCYVVKPFTSDQLFGAVDQAMRWKAHVVDSQIQGEFSFDVESDTEYLIQVNDLLSSLYLLTPLDDRSIQQLRMALLEIGQNAIEWGNKNLVDKIVKITYRVHPDRVTLTVRDEGPGFDPDNLPHAASPDDPLAHVSIRELLGLREGGFGILMSRGLVDDLQYNETGNEVTLVKRFPARRSK